MFEITKKEDIIIPFKKIGDENWEKNTSFILTADGDELPEVVTEEEIQEIEKHLGAKLPDSLKLFYKTFGVADIGEELIDLKNISYLKEWWEEDAEYGPDFSEEDKKVLPYLVWFGDYLGNGNMFCFHTKTHEIYYFDHDTLPYLTKLFDDFSDYLKGCLIFLQLNYVSDEKWAKFEEVLEEVVSEFISEEVIKKWRY
ncbi:SMI1/KNR4 family protein [Capnocytophaga stomatis]|uniref:SMI1/KNR4 family protein n=1 Tax=Capnocytophaga stomatis TaxID=1848904 RepID=A0ABW8QCR4_9FLAO